MPLTSSSSPSSSAAAAIPRILDFAPNPVQSRRSHLPPTLPDTNTEAGMAPRGGWVRSNVTEQKIERYIEIGRASCRERVYVLL